MKLAPVIERFETVDEAKWNLWTELIGECCFLHNYHMLKYYECVDSTVQHYSFALLTPEKEPVGIVPLFVSNRSVGNVRYLEASLNGDAMGGPAIASGSPSFRRKVVEAVYRTFVSECRRLNVKRILFQRSPLSKDVEGSSKPSAGIFEPIAFGFIAHPYNAVCIDLQKDQDVLLSNVSKYQRRHILRSIKKGLVVERFSAGNQGLYDGMQIYKTMHQLASGRVTRDLKSFRKMKEMAELGLADLFLCRLGSVYISSLFCGRVRDSAFGWSQANHPDYEREFSPRHYLEWEAIMHYRSNGVQTYYVGVRYFESQVSDKVTSKMVTISEAKERYGGLLLPYVEYEGFLDRDLASWMLSHGVANDLYKSDYLSSRTV
jgi:hypothetical protein